LSGNRSQICDRVEASVREGPTALAVNQANDRSAGKSNSLSAVKRSREINRF
jgi:hypothetical protein